MNIKTIKRISGTLEVEPVVESKSAKKVDKNLIEYVMTAIIEFSKRHRLTIPEASNYLIRFKGIDFLTEFYDVEHTRKIPQIFSCNFFCFRVLRYAHAHGDLSLTTDFAHEGAGMERSRIALGENEKCSFVNF